MGSWSESCVISGMEVAEGDDMYIAYLIPNKYNSNKWNINIPPIRGKYSDYGICTASEDVPLYDVKIGQELNDRDIATNDRAAHPWGKPIYIKAEVFDFIPTLEPEFSYECKTLQEKFDIHLANIYKDIAEAERRASVISTPLQSPVYYGSILGFNVDIMENAIRLFEDILVKRLDHQIFLEPFKRAFMLTNAMYELRKSLSPEVIGPQHGGRIALKQFYTHVLGLIQHEEELQRAAWYDDE